MLTAPPSAAPSNGLDGFRNKDVEAPHARVRKALGWRASEAFVTLSAAFAIFSDTIAYDLVIPFLPQLFTRRLGTPPDQVEGWTALTLEAFGLTQLIFTCLAGYIIDRSVSKSAPMIAGLVFLLVATLIFFLGTTEEMIIVSRGVQGASSGLVWVSAMAFLVSQVDDDNMGLYIGYTTLGLTVGELIGPLLGGSLYDTAGHWAVFGVLSVILLGNLVIRLLVREIRKSPAEDVSKRGEHASPSETDPLLGAAQAAGHQHATLTLPPAIEDGYGDDARPAPGADECSDSTAAVVDQGREALDGLSKLGWDCVSSVLGLIVVSTVRFGFEAVIPLFVLRHFSWSSGASGAVMSCLLLPNIAGPALGRYTSLHGPRWYSSIALFTCSVFLITLCFLTGDEEGASSPTTQVLFVLNVTAIGVGIAVTTITHGTALSVASPRAEDMAARATSAGCELSRALRLVTPGTMMSGLSMSWAVAIFLGPASANFFHFGTNQGFVRLCLFWSALCMAMALYSMFSWRKWK